MVDVYRVIYLNEVCHFFEVWLWTILDYRECIHFIWQLRKQTILICFICEFIFNFGYHHSV
jgi:hypothetical protein